MNRIAVLPPEVRDQIAAGEVVERPASIIKELVENSLDAGAQNISVTVKAGGKELIIIQDDGHGMTENDAQLSLQRHATSKISTINDLFSVGTYGFRGEALAAISSVSTLALTTKTADAETGTKLTVKSGHKSSPEAAPCNVGTHISVENLFDATPARKQYLKSDEAEYRAVYRTISELALAFPSVSFSLYKGEKRTLHLPLAAQNEDRTKQVFARFSGNLLPVLHTAPGLSISGMVATPDSVTGTRGWQYLLVNGRPVSDPKLIGAVRRAMISSVGLEKHLHPAFVLRLQIDPILVDVNVHPRKSEVKFAEPRDVYGSVISAVTNTLQNHSQNMFSGSQMPHLPVPNYTTKKPKDTSFSFPQASFSERHSQRNTPSLLAQTAHFHSTDELAKTPSQSGQFRFLAQVDNQLLVADGGDAMYIFDQHALHERQRFEVLLKQHESKSITTQALLVPLELSLSETEKSTLDEHFEQIAALGFVVKTGGKKTLLKSVPQIVQTKKPDELLLDTLHALATESQSQTSLEAVIRQIIETRACRGSVMFGHPMTAAEAQALLDSFAKTEYPDLCPHGRPNFYTIAKSDLMKHFHRA